MVSFWPYRQTLFLAAFAMLCGVPATSDNAHITGTDRRPVRAVCWTELRDRKHNDDDAEYAKWDRELNRVYQRALHWFHPEDKAALVASEKAWMRFRDADEKAISTLLPARLGFSPKTQSAIRTWRLSLVKERVALLKDYDLSPNHYPKEYIDEVDTRIDRWMHNAFANGDPSLHAQEGDEVYAAIDKATKMYDQELNRVYRKVIRGLDTKERGELVAAETAWLSYRDRENGTIMEKGTIDKFTDDSLNPELADDNWRGAMGYKMHLIKLRVLQLKRLDTLIDPPSIPGHHKPGRQRKINPAVRI